VVYFTAWRSAKHKATDPQTDGETGKVVTV
jgi:hypothetical protein